MARAFDVDGRGFNVSGRGFAPIETQTITLIDSFEDQDLSEYYQSPEDYNIGQQFPIDGNYSLRYPANLTGSQMYSDSGLNAYPQQGDIFKIDWQINTASADTSSFYRWEQQFAVDSADQDIRYFINYSIDGNSIAIWNDDTNTRIAVDFSVDYQANTHYQTEVVWDDGSLGGSAGDFTLTLTDVDSGTQVSQISGNDTGLTSGGIGFDTTNDEGGTFDFDYYRITNR